MSSWAPKKRPRFGPVATPRLQRCGSQGRPEGRCARLANGLPVPEVKTAIQAHRVERARGLDEVLGPKKYAANCRALRPAQQRGIEVGSVTKTRRYGGPPF